MATHEFSNQASQSERREVLRNDTYLARQSNTVDDAGGRFAKLTPSNVTGSSPQYPQIPSGPWAKGFDENVEPPLGFAVDEVPAQASLEVVGVEPPLCADDLGGSMAPADLSSDVETGPPKPEKRREW